MLFLLWILLTLAYGFESFQGIFISRVIKEGASEKAGIHVGDRLVEVGTESYSGLCSAKYSRNNCV